MNSMNGFSRPTLPNLFANIPTGMENSYSRKIALPLVQAGTTTVNPRYPGFAARMEDANLITDYRPHCYQNIPPHSQYFTKQWMIENTNDLIALSRERHLERTGAHLGTVNTVPPPAALSYTTPFANDIHATGTPFGQGLERMDGKVGELFGTFTSPYELVQSGLRTKKIEMTSHQEGGRNSIRGRVVAGQ